MHKLFATVPRSKGKRLVCRGGNGKTRSFFPRSRRKYQTVGKVDTGVAYVQTITGLRVTALGRNGVDGKDERTQLIDIGRRVSVVLDVGLRARNVQGTHVFSSVIADLFDRFHHLPFVVHEDVFGSGYDIVQTFHTKEVFIHQNDSANVAEQIAVFILMPRRIGSNGIDGIEFVSVHVVVFIANGTVVIFFHTVDFA